MTNITQLSRAKIQTQALCLAPEITLNKMLHLPPDNVSPLLGRDWHVGAPQQTLAKWSVKQLCMRVNDTYGIAEMNVNFGANEN